MEDVQALIEDAIHTVIRSVRSECIFDSHFVINQLIKHHSDAYLQYATLFSGAEITNKMHSQIAKKINSHDGSLIDRQSFESWSENIHGNASKCKCWIKR